ncbi:hypothetical protein AC579_10411 [Pseudocercospora musae]|uniref:Uncharacterized protein n=1 Tax=Pseudocercospora musae TaxID=113226 RepID=A0A139IM28_9PEZI|nr:hypothetical protein AC579_10411 [Pseudocercospora musae]
MLDSPSPTLHPRLQAPAAAVTYSSEQTASDNDRTLANLESSLTLAPQHNTRNSGKQAPPLDEATAVDLEADVLKLPPVIMNDTSFSGMSDDKQVPEQIASPGKPSGIPIPISSTGLTTLAYERALRNRIPAAKLARRGVYDLEAYKPTFVHDILMLPGSLANLIGKGSPEDIINRMTPAILPGVHSHIDSNAIVPRLIHSGRPTDHVQGMLIFGQGKDSRTLIHQRYRRQHAKRKRVQVEIEVVVPGDRATPEVWRIERRTITAHAWLFSRIRECPVCDGTENAEKKCPTWVLEEYLEGQLEDHAPLRIEADAKGDEDREDGYIGRDVMEYEIQSEQREVVMGGRGMLDYERATYFTGW